MSQPGIIQENLTATTLTAPKDTMSLWNALAILVIVIGVLAAGGYALGKYKFWKTYDTTPRLDRMEALYNEKVAADPNNPINYVNLGYVYFQKKDFEKAIADYRKAISLDDKNYAAHFNLGAAYAQTGKDDRAISEYQKAIDIAPRAEDAHLSLGMLYKAKSDWVKAEKELETANSLNPGDVVVLYNLGTVKEKQGNKDEAINIYQSAVQLMPTYTEAKQALQRLKSAQK